MAARPSAEIAKHAAVVLADRRRFLPALGDDELAAAARAGSCWETRACRRSARRRWKTARARRPRRRRSCRAAARCRCDRRRRSARRESRASAARAGPTRIVSSARVRRSRSSPRTNQTSPSSVTPTPVPSFRNWISPAARSRRHGLSAATRRHRRRRRSFAVERVTVVVTSCGHLGAGGSARDRARAATGAVAAV